MAKDGLQKKTALCIHTDGTIKIMSKISYYLRRREMGDGRAKFETTGKVWA